MVSMGTGHGGPEGQGTIVKKIDMHVHTCFSGDTPTEPEDMILAALEAGLDGIAFTEHDNEIDEKVFRSLQNKYSGQIVLLRGVELHKRTGLSMIAGSDAHYPEEVGMAYTEFFVDHIHGGNIAELLREGKFRPAVSFAYKNLWKQIGG
jgi:predicted metal-dependent phosphoesterase TrpH